MNLREQIITFNVHRLALPVVKCFTRPDRIPLPKEALRDLPEGSLGKSLWHFLDKNGFAYLPHFETHDAKHVLLDYNASGEEEACMQFYYIGNRHYSAASLATAFVSLFMMPESIRAFAEAFRRGRKSLPVGKLRLGEMLWENTESLKLRYCIPPRKIKS